MIDLPLGNAYWVLPEQWLAGEYPGGDSDAVTRARIDALLAIGIDAFVDLTMPEELEPYDSALQSDVLYIRKPFPDHGIPLEPEHMQEILGVIDGLLLEGRRVYLHCRAGIGRTGTVIGCHLANRGLRGDALIDALQTLWQTSERARSWPSIPETDEQRAYILGWPSLRDPTLDDDALAATRALRDRYTGAILGLAVGDALAAVSQFRRPGTFPPVCDLLGGGPFDLPHGGWSDDTAMALSLADSLLERDAFDARDQMERLVRWQREGYLSATDQCVGITASVTRALASANWRRHGFAGSHDPARLDPEPLSRLAPAVLFYFADRKRAIETAVLSARSTCQAPLVLDACRALASALHAALSGWGKADVLAAARLLPEDAPLRPEVAAIVTGGYREGLNTPPTNHTSALEVLSVCLAAFESTDNFRDGALLCVNRGRDSDAVGASFGHLAGAYYGAPAIPSAWRNSLIRKDLLTDYADRLLARVMIALGG